MAYKRKKLNEEILKIKKELEDENFNKNSVNDATATETQKESKIASLLSTTIKSIAENDNLELSDKNQNSKLTTTNYSESMSKIRQIKRTANPDNWKQAVRKRLRQSGQEYINANGKFMASKKVQEGCGATCYLKCSDRFTEEQRQTIHNAFWRLSDEQKNIFYWKYTSRAEPKRRRTPNKCSKRSNTFHYRFEIKGEMLPVCSKFFFSTLDVTARRIYYFYEHCYQEDTCMPRELRRGKNPKPTLPDLGERLNEVRTHIASFPSAKLSGSSQKRYLAEDLNLSKMYRMYVATVKNPLKQHWYCKVFNEEFKLGFRTPRSKSKIITTKEKTKDIEKITTDNNKTESRKLQKKMTTQNFTQLTDNNEDEKNPINIAEHKLHQQQEWSSNCLEEEEDEEEEDDEQQHQTYDTTISWL